MSRQPTNRRNTKTKQQENDEIRKRSFIVMAGEGIRTVLYAIKLWLF